MPARKLAQTEKVAAASTNREVIKNYCMADEWLDREMAAVERAVIGGGCT